MKYIKSLMQKVGKGEGGFTLIELLIVILILGIIAAVVVLNVGGFFGTGAKQAALMEKDAVQTALLAAMVDNNCNQLESGEVQINGGYTPCEADGGSHTVSEYLQGEITGEWKANASGLIVSGTYTTGGKTCTWDGLTGTMSCGAQAE